MRTSTVLLISCLAPALLWAQSAPAPDAIARSLQQRYQTIHDFSADFVHVYRGGVLRTETREEGTVAVKKPGRMRWVYTRPERKEFVADGEKIYSYIPEDRQVHIMSQDQANTPALFLAGQGDLVRDFTAGPAESPVANAVAVKLTPRVAVPEYDYIVIAADAKSFQIRALTVFDSQGGESTLIFTAMRENRGIADREFTFRIPRNVDVIEDR
jgi:outer membrane lipoprotein carrier protein